MCHFHASARAPKYAASTRFEGLKPAKMAKGVNSAMPAIGYRNSSVRSRNGSAAGTVRQLRSRAWSASARTVIAQELRVVVVAQRDAVQRVGQYHRYEARRQQQRAQKVLDHCAAHAHALVRGGAPARARRRTIERYEEREVCVAVHVEGVQPVRRVSAAQLVSRLRVTHHSTRCSTEWLSVATVRR